MYSIEAIPLKRFIPIQVISNQNNANILRLCKSVYDNLCKDQYCGVIYNLNMKRLKNYVLKRENVSLKRFIF